MIYKSSAGNSEFEVAADLDDSAERQAGLSVVVGALTESLAKGSILEARVANSSARVVEDIQELALHAELHLVPQCYGLAHRKIRLPVSGSIEPVTRTHGAGRAVGAQII